MELIPPDTSREGSGATPRQSLRIRAEEEEHEEGGATPISRPSTASGDVHEGSSRSPASRVDGFGSVATDPDDDSRPVTKKEFSRFRRVIIKTFQKLHTDFLSLLTKEIEEQ